MPGQHLEVMKKLIYTAKSFSKEAIALRENILRLINVIPATPHKKNIGHEVRATKMHIGGIHLRHSFEP